MATVILKPGREKSVLRHHPWIFSGAIAQIKGDAISGETVDVFSAKQIWLARGAYSHNSQIKIRIWTWNQEEIINNTFIEHRLQKAIYSRRQLYDLGDTNSFRLVHGESDGLPGLIVDRYADIIVVQYLSAGVEYWRGVINTAITQATGSEQLFERSDADVRQLEGLQSRIGSLSGDSVPDVVLIREHGLIYEVNIKTGHKTGFYLDQRNNRLIIRSLSEGRDILDCFCYTGGFSLNTAVGQARSILALDESGDALAMADKNFSINQLRHDDIHLERGDVFNVLRRLRDSGRSFDMIILDPPKFAPTIAQVQRAARGYKDINLLAMKLLRENGILITFSCSGGVSLDLFNKIVAGAALDSGCDFQTIGQLHQAADHPIAINFPEGAYLKGLILKRI
jgi:23S rRNA (cytosine1962-C5)-methyltransferase